MSFNLVQSPHKSANCVKMLRPSLSYSTFSSTRLTPGVRRPPRNRQNEKGRLQRNVCSYACRNLYKRLCVPSGVILNAPRCAYICDE
eukprot:870358-Pleurochrysis_carterae.AAC.2